LRGEPKTSGSKLAKILLYILFFNASVDILNREFLRCNLVGVKNEKC
jgi:hypothetical protein